MTAEISQEAVERMVALVCTIAGPDGFNLLAMHAEAIDIVALLPEPVDPDEAIVREIIDNHMRQNVSWSPQAMGMALLKRGRELALKAREGE